jgi:Tfp pilus assembly protein PilN
VGIIPFPIQSGAGLNVLLENMVNKKLLTEPEAQIIKALNLARGLGGKLTTQESAILQDQTKLDTAISFSFVGI